MNQMANYATRKTAVYLMAAVFFALTLGGTLLMALTAGAAPAAGTFTVTNAGDTDDGVCDADCSLREAVNAANAANGGTINFNNDFVISIYSALPQITSTIIVDGAGQNVTIIGAQTPVKLFTAAQDTHLTLKDLTLSQPNFFVTGGSPIEIVNGGALTMTNVLVRDSLIQRDYGFIQARQGAGASLTVTLDNVTFRNNNTNPATLLYFENGNLTIQDSRFEGNTHYGSALGGGVYLYGNVTALITGTTYISNTTGAGPGAIHMATNTGSSLQIINSVFQENRAPYGGTLYMADSSGSATIANSSFLSNTSTGSGGAILSLAPLVITDSSFISNTAGLVGGSSSGGGAIYLAGEGALSVSGSSFISNTANTGAGTGGGGAIAIINHSLIVNDSSFAGNSSDNVGGAIYAQDPLTVSISSSSLTDNRTIGGDYDGGGIYLNSFGSGTAVLTNVTLTGNQAGGNGAGGGLFAAGGGVLTVTNSTLAYNSAGQGGGLYIGSTTGGSRAAVITNTTIYSNTAGQEGGGARVNAAAAASFYNVTIAGNSGASHAGGLSETGTATFNVVNTIVADNTGAPDCQSDSGMDLNAGNLIENNGNCSAPAVNADPLLGPLQDNGGNTETMALLAGSPAMNAADNAVCPAADQRGAARPYPSGGRCDIGAFEATAPAAPVITAPANGSTLNTNTPTFTGTAEPGATITVTDNSGNTVCATTADSGGNWSCTAGSPLPGGDQTFSAIATNSSGIDSPAATVTVTLRWALYLPVISRT